MNYTVPTQAFQHTVTDMSRRHKLSPEQVAREAVALLDAKPQSLPPKGANKTEVLLWELSRCPPDRGLQAKVNKAILDDLGNILGRPTCTRPAKTTNNQSSCSQESCVPV